jgi:cytochrome c-type biogenesis protein CcmH/NrfF
VKRRPISLACVLAIAATWLLVFGTGAEDVYSERTLELARQLQCPICSGQSVADSQVTLAQQMRDTIERKVQAGESLWWIPPFVLAVGALVVVLYMREGLGRKPRGEVSESHHDLNDAELEALAHEFLHPDTGPRPS